MDLYENPEYLHELAVTEGLKYAKLSMWLGIAGIVMIFLPVGFFAGFICSIMAIVFARKSKARQVDTRMRLVGMITGVIGTIAHAAILVFALVVLGLLGVFFTGLSHIF